MCSKLILKKKFHFEIFKNESSKNEIFYKFWSENWAKLARTQKV